MTDAEIPAEAGKRLRLAISADRQNREAALDDMRNLKGEQWPAEVKSAREADGRPCLTINRLLQFLRQVTGDLRNMNPALKVMPGDAQSSEEVAELLEGLVRHIQYASDASSVYEGAAESAAACGMGFFRVLADYVNEASFDQEIRVERIHNPFSVYFDPEARLSTREDAKWCLITEVMGVEDFRAAYPGKREADADHDGTADGPNCWRDGGDVVIAEYFWLEPVKKTIWLLPGGQVVETVPPGIPSVRKREVTGHKVMWAKVSGDEVLEGPQEFPCRYIPVVAVVGEELHVGSEVYRSSVIRFAKDPQRLYNYWRSAQTEMVALQPKAPYLVTPAQVAGFETFWNEANSSNRPYLPYTPDPKAPGAPQRSAPPVPSSGMMQEVMQAAEDMKATTGIFDAGLGNRSNENSGVAIRQRQMESDVSTSIYSDNMAKAVAFCGRIILSMIPKIYDTARILRIVGKDDAESMVPVNVPVVQDGMEVMLNDLTSGSYDVRVAVGPNYSTLRQETAESMLEFVKAFPAAGAVTGDLVAKHMDWPGADEFADRLKALLPPGVAPPEAMGPEQQMQMQQAQAEAAQQAELAKIAADIGLREADARARKAEADAAKAEFAAREAEIEMQARLAGLVPAMQPGPQPLY